MSESKRQLFAVVTGGTKGIGLGVSRMLAGRGYRVLATFAGDERSARMAETFDGPGSIVACRCDQSSAENVAALVEHIRRTATSVDCLVCNAGITVRKPMEETTDADWNAMMQVSVGAHFAMVRDLRPLFADTARIIFTGSLMGLYPHAMQVGYGVTKAAVHALARNLVKEFEGTAITVNVVAPGFVETEWQKQKPEEIRASICRKVAAGRFATVDEIVAAYAFCLDNAYLNGATLEVSGGYSYK